MHACLLDNINTAGAMDALSSIVKATNVYLAKCQEQQQQAQAQQQAQQAAGNGPSSSGRDGGGGGNGGGGGAAGPQPLLLRKAAAYVTRILSVFGVVAGPGDAPGLGDDGAAAPGAGVSGGGGASAGGAGGGDRGAAYLDAFASFRDDVRALAKAKAPPNEILAACDAVRDGACVEMGVRLEDRPDGRAVWKLDDPAALRAERAARAAAAAEAARKKVENALASKKRDLEKFERLAALPPPSEQLADKYSKFDDETGEPTHGKDGAELEGKVRGGVFGWDEMGGGKSVLSAV